MKLEINNLSAGYGSTPVVEGLNLSLTDNEILMLVGPTGCGKSTILRALAGIIPVSAGEIRLNGHSITKKKPLPPEKRNVGMVFQDFALFPHLNVEKNIGFRLKDKTQVNHWIDVLGLEPHRKAMPATLSGGQKQRVALARALAHQPSLILLDEPLSNLDAALKDSLRWTIREALKEAKIPAIWVTHDQDEALSIGDKVGILNHGKLEQLDCPEQCFEHPASRFVAEFLGDASFLSGTLDQGCAQTAIGAMPVIAVDCDPQKQIDILVRPDDFKLAPVNADKQANAKVIHSRFEGGYRLCTLELLDGGNQVKVRVSHEEQLKPNDNVHLTRIANHPQIAYPAR